MQTTPCTARPRYIAMDLAEHFIAAMYPEADDGERERVQSTILCAGQHLADRGNPGLWDALEPAAFVAQMPTRNDYEVLEICVDLIGLYAWLGSHGLLDPTVAMRVLNEVRAAAPDHPVIRELCGSSSEMLTALGELDELG